MTDVLVDREVERDELRQALASAVAGNGTAIAVSGEAGIGKTALARWLRSEPTSSGTSWAIGAGWAGGGAPAFWPWTQVLRSLAAGLDDAALRDAAGLGAPYLTHLMPQLRARLPEIGEPPELDSDQARFNLFDAVLGFLTAVAATRPLVIQLDDLHAADAPTLRLLDFVVRHMHASPVLVLALYQEASQSEARALLAELTSNMARVRLAGLDRDAVAALAAQHIAEHDVERLAGRIHELTSGNPFFAAEVVRLMAAEGADGPMRLPEGVRATIWRRLEPITRESVEVLGIASVIGMEFRLETLALAAGLERDALLKALDEAVGAGAVLASSGSPDRYSFAHSLIRETLHADLAPSRRAQLHADVAGALERFYGDTADEHLAELSHHLLAAGSERGAEFAERAGHRELGRLAFEQAVNHFRKAFAVVAAEEPAGRRAAELLLALGEAQMRSGQPAEARETLVNATDIARRLDAPDLFARAVLRMVPWGFNVRVADEQLAGLAEEAIERLGDGDAVLRARLLSTLARTTYWTAALERRRTQIDDAIALARESGDEATLARVLGDAHLAIWNPDDQADSLGWIEEMLAIATRIDDRRFALDGHSFRLPLLLERGDVAGMDAAFALSSRMAKETKEPRALALVRRHEAARALIAGDFELAGRSLAESIELTNRLRADEMAVILVGAVAFAIAWHNDDLEPLVAPLRDFADGTPEFPAWRCALAASLARTGQLAEARRELAAARGEGFDALPRDNLWLVGTALAAEAAHRLGDAEVASELAAMLAPYGGRNVVTPDGLYFGPVDRFRALLAQTLGDPEAGALFERARTAAELLGARPVLALLDSDSGGAAAPPPAPASTAKRTASLRREGDYWRIAFAAEPFLLKDAKGLHHLARLLAQPDVSLHALDLAGEGVAREERVDDDAGAVLDAEAKAQYRTRIADLTEEIDEADSFNDTERAQRAREELAFLTAELSSAVGLGGRDRKAASNAERARVNVTRHIRGTIERIAGEDPALGRHLESAVRTGTFCEYRPEPGGPEWELAT